MGLHVDTTTKPRIIGEAANVLSRLHADNERALKIIHEFDSAIDVDSSVLLEGLFESRAQLQNQQVTSSTTDNFSKVWFVKNRFYTMVLIA